MPKRQKPVTEQDIATELGRRIKARRTELGKSQERVAHDAGLHWSFVSQVERGERSIRFPNLLKLAAGLDLDVGELVSGIQPPTE